MGSAGSFPVSVIKSARRFLGPMRGISFSRKVADTVKQRRGSSKYIRTKATIGLRLCGKGRCVSGRGVPTVTTSLNTATQAFSFRDQSSWNASSGLSPQIPVVRGVPSDLTYLRSASPAEGTGCGVVGGKIERDRREGPNSEVVLGAGEIVTLVCGSSKVGVDDMYAAS
jgi:hypothetical protein